jgi:TatA/E family protein of Tat protein translocase
MGLGGLGNPIVLLILLLIILLVFGRGRIPGLMGDMAKGINAFRSGLREGKEDEEATSTAAAAAEPEPAKTIEHDESAEPVKPAAKKQAAKKPAAKKPAAKKPAAKKAAPKKTTASKAK